MSPEEFFQQAQVRWCSSKHGKMFIREHHYSGTCHNGPMTVGLTLLSPNGFTRDLIGVCAFATPGSENVRASVWGPDHKDEVTELHRLVVLDDTPTNTESWFISRALRLLKERKPHLNGVLTFADSTEGHTGVIYRATNALFTGTTKGSARFWRDPEGRLRHPRQNGVNITSEMAAERGWTPEMRGSKLRYLYLLPNDRRHKRDLMDRLRLQVYPYPTI